ncbi:phosphatidylinositol alpha-1,6-mannosyltransferase [Pedobacter sp. CG_S7]|uniref:glycosyltransferase family 4 protein n=1 Tax=Pedobacter sp. CG_S7 TaxID=3143930 RepID=UPI003396585D
MDSNDKFLFLTLSIFSQTGGIQKVCRTMCKTLSDLAGNHIDLQVFSLCDKTKDLDERYLVTKRFKGFEYNRLAFGLEAIKSGVVATTIIISHINLAAVALSIKLIMPKTNIILIAHGIEVWRSIPFWKSLFMRKGMRIWSVSNFTATQLVQKHSIDALKVEILHNCLDPFFKLPATFSKPQFLLKRYNLTEKQPVLLVITRITKNEQDKGYNQIIKCLPTLLKEFPDLCYLLAGECDRDECLRLSEILIKNNLQHQVKLIGFIAEEELVDHYLLADIFILTSKKEGFGIVLIEAAGCGRKIICGNQDGSRDAVLNGEIGEIIDPENIKQLQKTISKILNNKDDLKTASQTQQTCIQNFNYSQYKNKVKKLLNAY